jgi:hypothetical protein
MRITSTERVTANNGSRHGSAGASWRALFAPRNSQGGVGLCMPHRPVLEALAEVLPLLGGVNAGQANLVPLILLIGIWESKASGGRALGPLGLGGSRSYVRLQTAPTFNLSRVGSWSFPHKVPHPIFCC